jgi:Mn2+/Fe2+ NRAMP family transporter
VLPEQVSFLIITTLVGGTVGGYITYAGAHRLVDSGITGPEHIRMISRGSVTGILVTGVMRALLFLAVLGVVSGGAVLAADNPPASAFEHALGEVGVRVFGVILWAASITSVLGASYTSVSFLSGLLKDSARRRNLAVVAFIAFCTIAFLVLGKAPVTLLVLAGALNGLILPVGLAIILWVAARRGSDLLGGYRYPRGLLVIGVLVWLLTVYLGWKSLAGISALWG